MTLYRVVNPATGQVESEFPTASDLFVHDAVRRSDSAFRSWRGTPSERRSEVLLAVADCYDTRADEMASLITREMGKPTAQARAEVAFAASIYRYYAEKGPVLLADQPLGDSSGGVAWVRKTPIGPLLGIMPWNYPHYQVARFVAPNLMIGNTILLKHAPQCPESALAIEAVFAEAGLPPDAYINLFSTNQQVAEVIASPLVCGVSVTGSERAGSAVAAIAGAHLKKVVLELGGSDPFIVLDTHDLEEVVAAAVAGRMQNAGQACNASKRIIVVDGLYDDFVHQFTTQMSLLRTGHPTDPEVDFGPLSSESAACAFIDQIEDAVAKGATLRTGGRRVGSTGAFVEATVLTDVTPEMRVFHEELFGPAAVVYRVADVSEAVALANDSPFGLGGVIFSGDRDLALEVADKLDTGMVWINEPQAGGPDLPFGGTKRSGVGRELGPAGIDEFVNKKLIHLPATHR